MSYLPCELCCLVRENNDVTDVLKAAADDHLAAVALVGAEGNSDILPTVRTEIFRFGGCGVTALGAHATLDGTANADETVSAIKASSPPFVITLIILYSISSLPAFFSRE